MTWIRPLYCKRKLCLWSLLLFQIVLIAGYFYWQKAVTSKSYLGGISFIANKDNKLDKLPEYYTLNKGSKIHLKRTVTNEYFLNFNSSLCFTVGTDLPLMMSTQVIYWQCECMPGWHGIDCGYPEVLLRAMLAYKKPTKLKGPRLFQRRIIYIFPFDEFSRHLTDLRVNDLGDIIDVFVIHERFGKQLENWLQSGFCQTFHRKILYVNGKTDNLWKQVRSRLINLRDDDIILTTEKDDVPNKNALYFLKLYDDFPEPITFRLKWTVFGFFWKHPSKTKISGGACTVAYLRNNLDDDISKLRNISTANLPQKAITLGDLNHTGGWFCEYCAEAIDIVGYLRYMTPSVVNWDEIQTINIKLISSLIENGLYIDKKTKLTRAYKDLDSYFAPQHALDRYSKFDFLIRNLYIIQEAEEEYQQNYYE